MATSQEVRKSSKSGAPVMAAAQLRAGGGGAGAVLRLQQGSSKGKEMPQPGKSHHEIEAGPGTRQGKC